MLYILYTVYYIYCIGISVVRSLSTGAVEYSTATMTGGATHYGATTSTSILNTTVVGGGSLHHSYSMGGVNQYVGQNYEEQAATLQDHGIYSP